jgi:hypothetical protein
MVNQVIEDPIPKPLETFEGEKFRNSSSLSFGWNAQRSKRIVVSGYDEVANVYLERFGVSTFVRNGSVASSTVCQPLAAVGFSISVVVQASR